MRFIQILMLISTFFAVEICQAQGPPITGDKPIMLSGGSYIFKTLTEVRNTNEGTFIRVPVMAHYLPTSNSLVAIHIPYISYAFSSRAGGQSGNGLGDVNLLGKYQFYRKDGTGKTFRMVAKTLQTLPTGEKIGIEGISTGDYAGYYGMVAGYESLKLGVGAELGYQWEPQGDFDKLVGKLGFGLPLLKPTYPVNQLNLYFEYTSESFSELNEYRLLYAQGIQYARKQWTWEAAIQFPLIQDIGQGELRNFNYSVFLGTRFII